MKKPPFANTAKGGCLIFSHLILYVHSFFLLSVYAPYFYSQGNHYPVLFPASLLFLPEALYLNLSCTARYLPLLFFFYSSSTHKGLRACPLWYSMQLFIFHSKRFRSNSTYFVDSYPGIPFSSSPS